MTKSALMNELNRLRQEDEAVFVGTCRAVISIGMEIEYSETPIYEAGRATVAGFALSCNGVLTNNPGAGIVFFSSITNIIGGDDE